VPRAGQDPACRDEDSELRAAALNALLQMDSERALPILKQVIERRDPCSVELRRKAMFLVSQKRGADVENILLKSAREDPDREVRAQAIFWLSQVNTERAVTALDSILIGSSDRELQEKAIFGSANALSCSILVARSSARRWTTFTFEAKRVRWIASWMAAVRSAIGGRSPAPWWKRT